MSGYLSISVPDEICIEILDEICIEILERLPVKSLVRFKAMRKSWKSLITDPSFVDHHLNRSAARCSKLAIFEELGNNSLVQLLDFGSTTNGEPTMMEFPSTVPLSLRQFPGCRQYLSRCCTFRGLLMVGSDSADSEFSLCNPCTRQSLKLPNPPNYKYLKRHYAAALGYDFILKTHKVVIIRKIYGHIGRYEIAVYNVKTNSWSDFEVEDDDDLNPACWIYSLTLANGAPHWITFDFRRDRYIQIAYFDFSKNELKMIPKPDDVDDYESQFIHLFDMEGRLCMGYFPNSKVEIWVMMEHGVGESWTRLALSCDEIPTGKLYKPISFAKDGMISLVKEDNGVAIYIGKTRRIEIKTIKTRIDVLFRMLTSPYVSPYIESLVSI